MTFAAILSFVLSNSTAFMIGGGILAVLIERRLYGRKQFKSGVQKTVTEYRKIDMEGAQDARKTAEQSLRDSDGVDADELLKSTDGLRDRD